MTHLPAAPLHIGPHTLANPWILAPMAGVSEMPFRRLARRLGAAAAPTELVSAKGLLYGQARTQRYLLHHEDEQPFWVQIFGSDVPSMVAGARRAHELGAKIIDINMGCPVRKVTKNGAGSGLLCDPPRAAALVRAMHQETGLPITVKIRAGWDADSLNYVEMTQRLADAGCCAIAMHARTRAQGYSGHANWGHIARLVQASPIPVIGNGDAYTAADARRMLTQTGCAAVMIGRGALGNPWVFAELTGSQAGRPTPAARWALVAEHLAQHLAHSEDPLRGIRRFRPHLMWYARGLVGAAQFRAKISTIDDYEELTALCAPFYSQAAAPPGSPEAGAEIEFEVKHALG